MKHIYVTGFMGVGKTTFGKQLATQLKLSFIDTDMLIERDTGKLVAVLFEEYGEGYFRALEAKILRSIPHNKPAVIAVGGGLPCFHDNMDFMNTHGFTLYLKASSSFIYNRLMQAKTPRPLLNGLNQEQTKAFIEQNLEKRSVFYLQSKMVIDVPSKDPKKLISSVFDAYRAYYNQ